MTSFKSIIQNSYRSALSYRAFGDLKLNSNKERSIAPAGHWGENKHRRDFLQNLGVKLGVKSWTDWYRISREDILLKGGSKVLRHYRGSLARALETLFPEYKWQPWRFQIVPRGFWMEKENQKRFLDSIAEQFGISKYDARGWSKITEKTIIEEGGHGLLTHCRTLSNALQQSYPEVDFSSRKNVPPGYWTSLANQKQKIEKIGQKLGIKKPEDWYSVSHDDIVNNGGGGAVDYHGSFIKALQSAYPEAKLLTWKFQKVTPNFWKNDENIQNFIIWATKKLEINELNDWYRVTTTQIVELGGSSILAKYRGIYQMLSQLFPNHKWDPALFQMSPNWGKVQTILMYQTEKVLNITDSDIIMNYKHPKLRFQDSKLPMELDIFIPKWDLAIEYQGEHHYKLVNVFNGNEVQERDKEKEEACKKYGITLISLPYWWDQSESSLRATLHKFRPDLVSDPGSGKAVEIIEPPKYYLKTQAPKTEKLYPETLYNKIP